MKRAGKPAATTPKTSFDDPAVEAVFAAFPKLLRGKLLALRRLVLETAASTEGVGEIEETLKWGQPSYLTSKTRSGSTIRLGEAGVGRYALYVHCQTDLVAMFQEYYPGQFTYGGNRSVIFDVDDDIPEPALRHCVALALTYHLNKRKGAR